MVRVAFDRHNPLPHPMQLFRHARADISEAGNYATTLSVLDILFGSFIYRPGQLPARIGVDRPEAYPPSGQVWRILLLPFFPSRRPGKRHSGR